MVDGKGPKEDDYVVLRSNRRKHLRSQLLVLKVKGENRRGVFFGYSKTIGGGGMFISTVSPRNVGEEFEISFKTPWDGTELRCRCVVAWQRGFDPKLKEEPGMGIRFLNLDGEVRAKTDEWVNKQ